MPRGESLCLQSKSDLIIVSTWSTEIDQGVVPGKINECFLLGKPTLVIIIGTVPDSELGRMVKKAGLGFVYETMLKNTDQDHQLSEFIMSLYDAAVHGSEVNLPINEEYIEQFNYKNITGRLIEILSDL
jgi:hypothetical protein